MRCRPGFAAASSARPTIWRVSCRRRHGDDEMIRLCGERFGRGAGLDLGFVRCPAAAANGENAHVKGRRAPRHRPPYGTVADKAERAALQLSERDVAPRLPARAPRSTRPLLARQHRRQHIFRDRHRGAMPRPELTIGRTHPARIGVHAGGHGLAPQRSLCGQPGGGSAGALRQAGKAAASAGYRRADRPPTASRGASSSMTTGRRHALEARADLGAELVDDDRAAFAPPSASEISKGEA